MKERILCAANYYDDGIQYDYKPTNIERGFVITGHRHHNCVFIFAKMFGFPYNNKTLALERTHKEGFLTNTNRFVDRQEAAAIAINAEQVITGSITHPLGLFSEDLY